MERSVHVRVDGRAQVVSELAGEATATLRLNSTLFMRLACGRVDPQGQLEAIELRGDLELARRVAANLAFTI